jgi:predicted metal-binding protein
VGRYGCCPEIPDADESQRIIDFKDVQTVTEMVFKIMTTNVQKLQGQLIMRAAQE